MGIAFSTNYVTDSEDFSQWTTVSTPVLTSGQVDPFGGTAAFLIEDGRDIHRIGWSGFQTHFGGDAFSRLGKRRVPGKQQADKQ